MPDFIKSSTSIHIAGYPSGDIMLVKHYMHWKLRFISQDHNFNGQLTLYITNSYIDIHTLVSKLHFNVAPSKLLASLPRAACIRLAQYRRELAKDDRKVWLDSCGIHDQLFGLVV